MAVASGPEPLYQKGNPVQLATLSRLGVALFVTLLAPQAHAIYKCQVGGQTVYQDRPCASGGQYELDAGRGSMSGHEVRKSEPQRLTLPAAPASVAVAAPAWRIVPLSTLRSPAAPPKGDLTEEQVVQLLTKSAARPTTKSEFETTADFQKRTAVDQTPKSFVVEYRNIGNDGWTYDADRQVLKIDFSAAVNRTAPALDSYSEAPREVRGKGVIWLQSGKAEESKYVGENAFGAKRVIEKRVADSHLLMPTETFPAKGALVVEVPMAAEAARKLKYEGRWRFSGTMVGQGVKKWTVTKRPTLSDPEDSINTYYLGTTSITRVEMVDPKGAVYAVMEPAR